MIRIIYIGLVCFTLFSGDTFAQCSQIDFNYSGTTGCVPLSVKFNVTGFTTGSSFSWDFGNGFNSYIKSDSFKIHIFLSAGTFNVSLRVKDSSGNICQIDKPNLISVGQATQVKLYVINPVICNNRDSAVIYDSTPGVVKREWIIDGQKIINNSPQIKYKFNQPGYKSLTLKSTTTAGCIYTKTIDSAIRVFTPVTVTVNPKATTFCPGYTDTFLLTPTIGTAVIQSYKWIFENGSPDTSSVQHPAILYNDTGIFDVELTLTTTLNCIYNFKFNNLIKVFNVIKPTLAFSTTQVCNEDTMYISNTTPSGNLGGNYALYPGGGYIVSGNINSSAVGVTFPSNGKYTIKITYANQNCYADTIYDTVIVKKTLKSVLKYGKNIFCEIPDTVEIWDSVYSVPQGSNSYLWELTKAGFTYGLSAESNPRFPVYEYGKYDLSYTVTNNNGCTITVTKSSAVIADTPVAKINISPLNACPGDTIDFNDGTNKFSFYKTAHQWEILDTDTQTVLLTDTNTNTNYIFQNSGRYFARLIVSDRISCTDTIIDTIGVLIGHPNVDFSIEGDTVCSGKDIILRQETTPPFKKLKYTWKISHHDSTNVTYLLNGDSVSFSPLKPGYYDITCIGNNSVCSDTLTIEKSAVINQLRISATVDSATVCVPVIVDAHTYSTLNVHLSNPDTNIIWLWGASSAAVVFSDSSLSDPTVTFTQGGCYNLSVTAVNSDGCVDQIGGLFNACVGDIADFSTTKTIYCAGDTIRVNNTSKQNTGYKWIIKNNLPASILPYDTSTNPIIICADSGDYEIALIAYTSFGCPDTSSQKVSIKKPYSDFVSPDSLSVCGPTLAEFRVTTKGGINYNWNFGDNSAELNTNVKICHHIFQIKDGHNSYDITLTVTDQYGCIYKISKKTYIKLLGPAPKFIASQLVGCDSIQVHFTDSSKGTASYFFYSGAGVYDTILKNNYTYYADPALSVSSFMPYIVGYDSGGQCAQIFQLQDSIRVFASPHATGLIFPSMICKNDSVTLTDISSGSIKSTWYEPIENQTGFFKSVTLPLNKTGWHDVKLITENIYGCSDTILYKNAVRVIAPPTPSFYVNDTLFCLLDTVLFQYNGKSEKPIIKYLYNFDDSLVTSDTSDVSNPGYVFGRTGYYKPKLYVIDSLGCSGSYYFPDKIIISSQLFAQPSFLRFVSYTSDTSVYINWNKCPSGYFLKYTVFRESYQGITPIYSTTDAEDTTFIDFADSLMYKLGVRYGILSYEPCYQRPQPEKWQSGYYITGDTLNPMAVYTKWKNYQGGLNVWSSDLLYTTHPDSTYRQLIPLQSVTDSMYISPPLCDSDYFFKISGYNPDSTYYTSSNVFKIKPFYKSPVYSPPLYAASVEGNYIHLKGLLLGINDTTRGYILLKKSPPDFIPSLVSNSYNSGSFVDSFSEPGKTYYIYTWQREDHCGQRAPEGSSANSVFLSLLRSEDTLYFNWNSVFQWKKGVKNYFLQFLNPESGLFENRAILSGKDTSFHIDKPENLFDPEFCYRIMAIGNDRLFTDTSYSNIVCTSYPAMVFIPDAFTPNDDGLNDVFIPVLSFVKNQETPGAGPDYTFIIYNRWGQVMFETHNIHDGWNGKFNDKNCQDDVYYYRVLAKPFIGHEKINIHGTVKLLR